VLNMTKTFRPYSLDQQLVLPPDVRAWLPEGDVALVVSDVVDELDRSAIYAAYESGEGRGQPPYHPAMMVKLLLYGYCVGTASSRKIERATYRDVAFRVLAGDQHPDHDSIAEFRARHLGALAALFVQVLRLCQAAGLVTLGHVALDGTKLKANASKHKAMSYARREETERRLEAEVRAAGRAGAAREAPGEDSRSESRTDGGGPSARGPSGRRGAREARGASAARGRGEGPAGAGARPDAGPAHPDRAAERHRSGVADHGRRGPEGIRARL
jgi:transposase